MADQDEVQGISLKLTEEDIRVACDHSGVPLADVVSIWRRFRALDGTIQVADVLYVMALAKSKNLNPIDNNYALIPRGGNKGFSLTFTKDAALAVITRHPEVKRGTMKRWFVDCNGTDIPWAKSPSWKKFEEVDWALEAHITVEDVNGVVLEGVAKYRNSFAAGNDGNPKFLWMKDAGGMTMKQAYKDLANTQFGGGLPDEEAIEGAQLTEAITHRGLEPPTIDVEPSSSRAADSQEIKNDHSVDLTSIIEKGAKLNITQESIIATLKQQEANGMSREVFEQELDKEIANRERAAATPARTRRAAKAETTEAPKERKKKEPKPLTYAEGFVDAVSERYKDLPPRKEGEPNGKQPYMVISINRMDMTVWHKSMFDAIYEAHESNPQKRVKVGYTVSLTKEEPPREFAEVEEFQILDDEILGAASESAEDVPLDDKPLMETESVDPAGTECKECGASFGIHLKTCSHFKDPNAKQSTVSEPMSKGGSELLFKF